MAIDLVGSVSRFITPQLVGSLATAVGISEATAQKLLSAAIPVVLGALATTAAAPGGAQKLADAVSNSDPDLPTKLSAAISGGNQSTLNQGVDLLGGLLGGSGVSTLAGVLSQYSGAPQPAAQSAIGAVTQSAIAAIGQQDPSNWSDSASIAAMFGAQKEAIAAAVPPEISRALGATGLLAGLGGLRVDPFRTASAATSRPAAPPPATPPLAPTQPPVPPASRRFPIWAIILLIIIILAAIWWWAAGANRTAEPAKTGMLHAPIALALIASLAPPV